MCRSFPKPVLFTEQSHIMILPPPYFTVILAICLFEHIFAYAYKFEVHACAGNVLTNKNNNVWVLDPLSLYAWFYNKVCLCIIMAKVFQHASYVHVDY